MISSQKPKAAPFGAAFEAFGQTMTAATLAPQSGLRAHRGDATGQVSYDVEQSSTGLHRIWRTSRDDNDVMRPMYSHHAFKNREAHSLLSQYCEPRNRRRRREVII